MTMSPKLKTIRTPRPFKRQQQNLIGHSRMVELRWRSRRVDGRNVVMCGRGGLRISQPRVVRRERGLGRHRGGLEVGEFVFIGHRALVLGRRQPNYRFFKVFVRLSHRFMNRRHSDRRQSGHLGRQEPAKYVVNVQFWRRWFRPTWNGELKLPRKIRLQCYSAICH
jgi:hypothetical protein